MSPNFLLRNPYSTVCTLSTEVDARKIREESVRKCPNTMIYPVTPRLVKSTHVMYVASFGMLYRPVPEYTYAHHVFDQTRSGGVYHSVRTFPNTLFPYSPPPMFCKHCAEVGFAVFVFVFVFVHYCNNECTSGPTQLYPSNGRRRYYPQSKNRQVSKPA